MKKFIVFSLLFHLGVLAVFLVFPETFSDALRSDSKKNIEESVKVELVGMPNKTLKQLKNFKKVNQTKSKVIESIVKPKDNKILEPKGSEVPEKALKVLAKKNIKSKKKENKIKKKLKKVTESKKKVKKEDLSALDELVHMGNQISKGESLDSNKVSQKNLEDFESYALKVKEKIKTYWELPAHLLGKKNQCEVQVFINERGRLLKSKFISKSKDEEFNKIVLSVIRRASPFAAPSKNIKKKIKNGAIGLGFPF